MPSIENQKEYWNKVAGSKTFTHPLDADLVAAYFNKDFKILDYGCGYGRLTQEFYSNGFTNITGVDTSAALIERGQTQFPALKLQAIETVAALNNFETDFDAVLLFAVITCIPPNAAQKKLVQLFRKRLKEGGYLYISDYYLQENSTELKAYTFLNNDPANAGVFSLPEGAVFRHHTKEWIKELLQDFEIVSEKIVPVTTMNGHVAEAFQILARNK